MAPQSIQARRDRERGKVNRCPARGESVTGGPEARHGPRKPQKLSGIQMMLVWECVPVRGGPDRQPLGTVGAPGERLTDAEATDELSARAEGPMQGPSALCSLGI